MKKILTAVLSLAIIASNATMIFADDINNAVSETTNEASLWAKNGILAAKNIGLVKDNESFLYKDPINRENFCELIYNYYTLLPKDSASPDTEIKFYENSKFTDTDNPHIEELRKLGIVDGKSKSEFAPDDYLVREEAATIIFRLINKLHPNWTPNEAFADYNDSEKISDWAFNAVLNLTEMKIMSGVENNNFSPDGLYTAEQAIITLVRTYYIFNDSEFLNVENMTYPDIENLQKSVDNGHQPWRLDCEQVINAFLLKKGVDVEKTEILLLDGTNDTITAECKTDNTIIHIELFKPIDKSENGVWIVKSFAKDDIIGGADDMTQIIVNDIDF